MENERREQTELEECRRREQELAARLWLGQEAINQGRHKQEQIIQKEETLISKGRSIITNALDDRGTQPVEEVPFAYLKHISNHWEKMLGSGGFGSVYKGEVAVKALWSDCMSKQDIADFEEEIQVCGLSSHHFPLSLLCF